MNEGTELRREPLSVVTTIFPQFDFIRQIAGDRVELTMLISPGAESHSFEPSPRDMVTINNADLLVYIGGHSEGWVHPILESLEREDMRTVALAGLVGALLEVAYHGHRGHHAHHDLVCYDDECDHDHHEYDHDHHEYDHDHHECDHDHHECDHDHQECDHDHHHHFNPDEHVWTSPRNAAIIVAFLAEVLAEMDPSNADYFRENAAAYIEQLTALDQAFEDVVANAARQTIVFGDRFPFRYLADAYSLTYYAAFDTCCADTQASPARIAYLINKVQNENIPVVFYIEFSNQGVANVIAEATGARLLEMHSLHNVSHADFTAGITYLEVMLRNLERLQQALN